MSQPEALVERLYAEYHDEIYAFLYRRTRNTHLSEDLASETFERALRYVQQPEAQKPYAPKPWLYKIASNLLIDHYRKASVRHEESRSEIVSAQERGDDAAEHLDSLAVAQSLIKRLPPTQRAVIGLQALCHQEIADVAEILGRSPQAVRALRHRAIRTLRMDRDEFDGEAR